MVAEVTTLRRMASAERKDMPEQVSTFARNVGALLERAEYRRCDKGEDLEDIYRLRYKAYRSNDMVPDSETHSIHDDLDETPNAYRFGVYVDQFLVSTLRIHHVTSDTPWSPSTKAFGDIVYPMLAAGDTFVVPEPLRFRSGLDARLPAFALCDAAAGDDGVLLFQRAVRSFDGP